MALNQIMWNVHIIILHSGCMLLLFSMSPKELDVAHFCTLHLHVLNRKLVFQQLQSFVRTLKCGQTNKKLVFRSRPLSFRRICFMGRRMNCKCKHQMRIYA